MAPEYAIQGKLSEKVDVYSYGVVVLEIISGRKSSEIRLEPITEYLIKWVNILKSISSICYAPPAVSWCICYAIMKLLGKQAIVIWYNLLVARSGRLSATLRVLFEWSFKINIQKEEKLSITCLI